MQALSNPQNKELNVLASALSVLLNATRQTVLQWIPAHIPGNKEVDILAKEGGKLDQEEREVTYKEAKTIVYHKEKIRWLKQHPSYNSEDNCYQLSREGDNGAPEDWILQTQAPFAHKTAQPKQTKQDDSGGSATFCFSRILFSAACWCFFSSTLSKPLRVA